MTIWEKKYECRYKHINKYLYFTAKQQDKHKQTNEQVQYLQFNGIFQVILILILTLEWSIFLLLTNERTDDVSHVTRVVLSLRQHQHTL